MTQPNMLPQDISEQLTIREYTTLCSKVEGKYHQRFGVIDIVRGNPVIVTVELDDDTQHRIIL
jgi:hypothetical protein